MAIILRHANGFEAIFTAGVEALVWIVPSLSVITLAHSVTHVPAIYVMAFSVLAGLAVRRLIFLAGHDVPLTRRTRGLSWLLTLTYAVGTPLALSHPWIGLPMIMAGLLLHVVSDYPIFQRRATDSSSNARSAGRPTYAAA